MGYSFRLATRVLLCASSHRHDNTDHGLCYTSRGALAGTRNKLDPVHNKGFRLCVGTSSTESLYVDVLDPCLGAKRAELSLSYTFHLKRGRKRL